jgi:hypothetical protein
MSEPRPTIKTMDDVRKLIFGDQPPTDPEAERERERARRERLKADKQWHDYLCDHPRDQYPAVLEEIKDLMTTAEWCKEVRFAWYDSQVLMNNREAWIRIFSDRERIGGITTPNETARFESEKDPLTVYRGCLPQNVDGMSWSLSFDAAEYFKRQAGPHGVIFSGTVRKQDVIAYICPNNEEFEVIVLPEHVSNKENLG